MKVRLDMQKIKGPTLTKQPIQLLFRLGNDIRLTSQIVSISQGAYPIHEKHTLWLDINQSYIEVVIMSEGIGAIAQITLFIDQFKKQNKVSLGEEKEWELQYAWTEIREEASTDLDSLQLRREPSIQRKSSWQEEQGKVEVLRLGLLMFNFAQRLDPLLWMWHKAESLLFWRQPYQTAGCGLMLSLAIYYPKMAILLCGVALFLCQKQLFNYLSALNRYQRLHQRLIIPDENALFLQNNMDAYCHLYEELNSFICGDDKTLLVNSIIILIRATFIFLLLLLLLGIEHLLVLALWTTLLLTSPMRRGLGAYLKPAVSYLLGESGRVFDVLGRGITTIKTVLTNSRNFEAVNESIEFYYYHYERWWLFEGWKDEQKKYSDDDYQCIVCKREDAPSGYAWIEEWRIDMKHGEVDSQGYQYANDLNRKFQPIPVLATRRRRRWKRSCQPFNSSI